MHGEVGRPFHGPHLHVMPKGMDPRPIPGPHPCSGDIRPLSRTGSPPQTIVRAPSAPQSPVPLPPWSRIGGIANHWSGSPISTII